MKLYWMRIGFLFDKVFLFYPWYISVYDKCHRIIMTSKSQKNEYFY